MADSDTITLGEVADVGWKIGEIGQLAATTIPDEYDDVGMDDG